MSIQFVVVNQQLYNSEMPMSRCGMQYSPAVAVGNMHTRSVVDQDLKVAIS
jgi:hypothetical protein